MLADYLKLLISIFSFCCVFFSSFYIILAGKVSIFIINKDKDGAGGDEMAAYAEIGAKDKDGKLDRAKLGNFATSLGKSRFSFCKCSDFEYL